VRCTSLSFDKLSDLLDSVRPATIEQLSQLNFATGKEGGRAMVPDRARRRTSGVPTPMTGSVASPYLLTSRDEIPGAPVGDAKQHRSYLSGLSVSDSLPHMGTLGTSASEKFQVTLPDLSYVFSESYITIHH
jgi:hypothetical protein